MSAFNLQANTRETGLCVAGTRVGDAVETTHFDWQVALNHSQQYAISGAKEQRLRLQKIMPRKYIELGLQKKVT